MIHTTLLPLCGRSQAVQRVHQLRDHLLDEASGAALAVRVEVVDRALDRLVVALSVTNLILTSRRCSHFRLVCV